MRRRTLALVAATVVSLTMAGDALACVCGDAPLEDRLERADAAVVGRIVRIEEGDLNGAPQRLLTVEVDQRVKGAVERTLLVRSPSGTTCDVRLELDRAVGLLLTRGEDDAWLATACSVVEPGPLVVVGGEPRGGAIKVAVGVVILALVLALSFWRLRRGSRPELPGAPGP
ncbi:MAG: hypothetical protein KatS3mg012_1790 [Gaiellaceae bacterium]|nr:MAG: hypothetical protein KatS3mg012_1790 [Gaiellaceae bacterium]